MIRAGFVPTISGFVIILYDSAMKHSDQQVAPMFHYQTALSSESTSLTTHQSSLMELICRSSCCKLYVCERAVTVSK